MIIQAIKTRLVTPGGCTLEALLDESIDDMSERSVLAVAGKVVSFCENRTLPYDSIDKDELVSREAQLYIPSEQNPYGVTLSVARNLLVASAGIDESNSAGRYVLWPSDPQASANHIRDYLRRRFDLNEVGVILTDSATRPFQWGTTGISLAYSGFNPLYSYIGQKDLFGRPFEYHTNNIQHGLAAAATLVMGEGAEQTPLGMLSDLDFVEFVDHDPTPEELARLRIDLESDVYAPLLKRAPWHKGKGAKSQ